MIKKELTILDLIEVLKKAWIFMILAALLLGFLAKFYTDNSFKQLYSCTMTFNIDPYKNENGANPDMSVTDSTSQNTQSLRYATTMMTNYIQYLKFDSQKNYFAETCQTALGRNDSFKQVVKNSIVDISPIEDTYFFRVTIVTADVNDCVEIARVLSDCIIERIRDQFGNNTLFVADMPKSSRAYNFNNSSKNMITAAAVGALGVYAIFFLVNLFDVRIKTKDELIKTYDLPLLGTIPDFESTDSKHYGGGYGYGYGSRKKQG